MFIFLTTISGLFKYSRRPKTLSQKNESILARPSLFSLEAGRARLAVNNHKMIKFPLIPSEQLPPQPHSSAANQMSYPLVPTPPLKLDTPSNPHHHLPPRPPTNFPQKLASYFCSYHYGFYIWELDPPITLCWLASCYIVI